MNKEVTKIVLDQKAKREERQRLRERKKRIIAVNGFYASTERGAKIHMTKIRGRYL